MPAAWHARCSRAKAQAWQGHRRDLHCKVRKRNRCAPNERLQRTEARTNVINNLVELDGVIGSRQAVMALYATEGAVKRHVSGP